MARIRLVIFLFFWVLVFARYARCVDLLGKVVAVFDGDTLLMKASSATYKVRLYGIDSPERGQNFNQESTLMLRKLALNKEVRLEQLSVDAYARTVGIVYLFDGTNLNYEQLRLGLAWWYKRYAPDKEIFKQLEDEARAKKLGLWSQDNPVPPWIFRRTPEFKKQRHKKISAVRT